MFSTIELNGMRDVQQAHMMDNCVIYRVTSRTKNTRGIYDLTFDGGTESICGVQMDPLSMYDGSSMRTADVDVILRLPLGTEVTPQDEIEITHRFGERIRPKRYEVMRYTNDGPSGCRAYLKVRTVQ
jgi:hypothetical protein